MNREKRPRKNPGRRWPSSSQAERPQEKPTLPILWSQTSSLWTVKQINFHCSGHLACGTSLLQPQETETLWAATLVVEMQRASLVMETLRWVSRWGKIHMMLALQALGERVRGLCALWVQGSMRNWRQEGLGMADTKSGCLGHQGLIFLHWQG